MTTPTEPTTDTTTTSERWHRVSYSALTLANYTSDGVVVDPEVAQRVRVALARELQALHEAGAFDEAQQFGGTWL